MLSESVARVEALPEGATVLDVGGWACPLARATHVLDYMPHATRGLYGWNGDRAQERFTEATWTQHDICAREPFPYADDSFDLVVCSHTLEDVRDPVWVASELSRIGRAGYVEVPSRLEEQSWGVEGEWVGWSHHHWLIDVDEEAQALDFVFKLHALHRPGATGFTFSAAFAAALQPRERVEALWWEGALAARERTFPDVDALVAHLREPVARHGARDPGEPSTGRRARVRRRLAKL